MENLKIFLDELVGFYSPENANIFLDRLVRKLGELRKVSDDQDWEKIKNVCDNHPILGMCLADPFTKRAREKPRGYAGDAGILDYAYYKHVDDLTDSPYLNLFNATTQSPSAKALIWRIELLGQYIDQIIERKSGGRVLSLACGHLREVEYSQKISSLGELIAIDQDKLSLAIAKDAYERFPIRFIHGSLSNVLKKEILVDSLDLAYAAGLYDYLNEKVAKALTNFLFNSLTSKGCLIIPNFLLSVPDRGYMESFMDWSLILRTKSEIIELANDINKNEIAEIEYFEDPYGCIGYLKITKN